MKKVTINGVPLPAVGIGTWNVGDHPDLRQEEIAAIQAGINTGARVVDTAEMYGNGRSERLVKEAIAPFAREKLFLIDKVLPQNASARLLERSLDRSLQNVGTDYFDLYLLHWRGTVPLSETVTTMEEMVKKGKIRSWGVSNFDVSDLQELWALPKGDHCVANQDLYNLDERGIEFDLIPLMRAHHLPLIAYSPLAQGDSLSGKLANNKVLQEIAANHQATIYQVMLAWTLREPDVLAIPKSSSVQHAQANVQAGSLEFTADERKQLAVAFPKPTSKQPLAVI
jgi:diketogulonate reductase-like aldo/keto reductase